LLPNEARSTSTAIEYEPLCGVPNNIVVRTCGCVLGNKLQTFLSRKQHVPRKIEKSKTKMALTCSYYRNYKKDLSEINSNIRLEIFVPWFKVKLSDETKVNLLRKRSAIYNNKLVLLGLFSSNSSRCKMLAFGTESKSKKQSVGSPGHARSPDPNTLLEVCLH
jgi:hypothetical protein